MGRFFATSIFIACIFFVGMFFGVKMTESESIIKSESITNAYEEWELERKEIVEHNMETEDRTEINIYSTTAKSLSDMLKNLSRTVVFQVLSAFDKIIGSS